GRFRKDIHNPVHRRIHSDRTARSAGEDGEGSRKVDEYRRPVLRGGRDTACDRRARHTAGETGTESHHPPDRRQIPRGREERERGEGLSIHLDTEGGDATCGGRTA